MKKKTEFKCEHTETVYLNKKHNMEQNHHHQQQQHSNVLINTHTHLFFGNKFTVTMSIMRLPVFSLFSLVY